MSQNLLRLLGKDGVVHLPELASVELPCYATFMANGITQHQRIKEAMVKIPLSALRYLSRYPRRKKIVVEIATDDIVRVNSARTLDEIISEARLDYAMGNYSSHRSAKGLIAALRA